MTCRKITDGKGKTVGHICAPRPSSVEIHWYNDCHGCHRRSPFVVLHYFWYGVDAYCLRCGEFYTDGERAERPFAPRWRKENMAHAREIYRRVHPKP